MPNHSQSQPKILSGREASLTWLSEIKKEVANLKKAPGLGILQVGDLPASSAYIRQKLSAAQNCGMQTQLIKLAASSRKNQIFFALNELTQNEKIDGVIVQLPLDRAQSTAEETRELTQNLLDAVPPEKDADGLTTFNQGKLITGQSHFQNWTSPLPATPYGILKLISLNNISLSGINAVVIGRSRLVGTPVAHMLSQAGASVTILHKQSKNPKSFTQNADLIVVAAGSQHLLTPDWIQKSSIVIDVGIHRTPEGSLTGDVNPSCYPMLSAYSPVPGGVGPMTVAALLQNVLNIAKLKASI